MIIMKLENILIKNLFYICLSITVLKCTELDFSYNEKYFSSAIEYSPEIIVSYLKESRDSEEKCVIFVYKDSDLLRIDSVKSYIAENLDVIDSQEKKEYVIIGYKPGTSIAIDVASKLINVLQKNDDDIIGIKKYDNQVKLLIFFPEKIINFTDDHYALAYNIGSINCLYFTYSKMNLPGIPVYLRRDEWFYYILTNEDYEAKLVEIAYRYIKESKCMYGENCVVGNIGNTSLLSSRRGIGKWLYRIFTDTDDFSNFKKDRIETLSYSDKINNSHFENLSSDGS